RQPTPPHPAPAPATPPVPGGPNAPAAQNAPAAGPPTGEHVALGPITDQVVVVDQVGYLPGHRKIGLVSDAAATATSFQVVDVQSSRGAFAAALSAPVRAAESGQ